MIRGARDDAGKESVVNEALGASMDPMAAIDTSINLLMMELRQKAEASGVAPMLPWTRFDKKVLDRVASTMNQSKKSHYGKIYFPEACLDELRIQKGDGVHLTESSVDKYADYIMSVSRKMVSGRQK